MRTPKPGEWLAERTDLVVPPGTVRELANSAPAAHARTYRMCGQLLRLGCDDPAYAARFARAFLHMAAPDADAEPATELVFLTRRAGPDGFPALLLPREGRAHVFEHEAVSPTQLCAAMFLGAVLPIDDHVVLHASVLERGGLVTAFLGRTHAGKTTLALALALEEGVGFLSDEYCPIRLADGFVEPFPRALGIRRWTRQVLVERGALPEGIGRNDDAQVDVDPATLRGFHLAGGGRLRNVVVVSGEAGKEAPEGIRDLDVEFVSPALLTDLKAVPGVRDVEPRPELAGSGHLLRVHVGSGATVTDALLAVCERHGMRLHGLLPPGARRPDFAGPPLLKPLDPFRGLVEMVRHTVNRTALEHRIGDASLPRLLDAIAPAVRDVRFFELRPGPLDATVRVVKENVL